MSDFGMFEADEVAANEPRRQARTAARKLDAAIDNVRANFGRFLLGATGIDEFEDRWHLSKNDIRASVEPMVFPNTGTMRRIQNAMKSDWKLAHPYKLAMDHDSAGFGSMPEGDSHRNQDLDETYSPSSGNLIPEGNFESWKDSVDQDGPEKVSGNDFTPGGDSGSDKHARRRQATEWKKVNNDGYPAGADGGNMTKAERDKYNAEEDEKHGLNHEAARLVADIYTDFARSNGLRVASLDTLDAYASTGIAKADFRLLAGLIVRQAEAECDEDCEDEDTDSEAPEASESDESDSDDDEGDDYDFGGEDAAEDDTDDDGDHDDDDHHDFGDTDSDGDHDDDDHHDGGEDDYDFGGDEGGDVSQTFTVPEHAPELDPQMLNEIPHDDTDGSAPVPPEVIDSLLGLPEGTIEQLLLEEVEQGQGGSDGYGAPPQGGGDQFGGAPQGGGDDFLGEGGDDAEQEPPRVARRRQARQFWAEEGSNAGPTHVPVGGSVSPSGGESYVFDGPAMQKAQPSTSAPSGGSDPDSFAPSDTLGVSPHNMQRALAARRFWAAEGDEQPAEGGGEQAAPAQDPAAAMGGGMQQPMMPPPGSGAVAPPAPPQQLENQPAEDALLDTANQAIMQMIDQETAEYQQIIDPLSQALQAIQFAQQVEQSEHPMDVTPPEGTVNVDPSAAPGGAQAMQQQARRRQAKVEFGIHSAAKLIAARYRLSATGHQMLLNAALGRRGYEHVVEALKLVPAEVRKAAAIHMSHLFAAGNQRFNRDVFMKTVMAGTSKDRYENSSYTGPRDKRRDEHGEQDMDDDDDDDGFAGSRAYQNWKNDPHSFGRSVEDIDRSRQSSRGRLPFDRPRLAGETWTNTPTKDAFEFPNAGEVARVDDNNDTNNLPVMKGADPHGKNAASEKAVDRFQRWQKSQQQRGLPTTQGESAVHNFLQTHNPIKKRVGPNAADMIHRELGLNPDSVKTPRAKPVKAVNPTLKGKGGKTPAAPMAKAPAPKAAPKTATWGEWEPTNQPSFFTRKVAGWRWDDHLNGYLSKEARSFTCACGEKIAAPSYKTCACGKVWNVYAIGDSHHLASDTADVYIAREIEVRPGVIMANRKMAAPDRWFEDEQEDLHRQRRQEEDDADAWAEKRMNTPHRDDEAYREASRKTAGWGGDWENIRKTDDDPFPSMENYRSHEDDEDEEFARKKHDLGGYYPGKFMHADKGDCTCWEGYERVPGTEPCASKSCRKKTSGRKLAGEDQPGGVPVSLSNNGGETWNVHQPGCRALNSRRKQRDIGGHEEAREFPDHKSVVMDVFPPDQFDYDPDHPRAGWKYYKKYVKLHDCIKGQIPEDASQQPHTASRRAQATFKQYLAEIERLADWTKYDGPDPSRDPKAKPPSTTIKSQPGDWTNRDFTGPTKGQWREPDPTELPRKTRKKK